MTTNTFIAGRGFLYHMDARAKLLLVLLLCITVFLPLSHLGLWSIFFFTFLVTWRATGFKQALEPLKAILFVLILMTLFVPLTYRNGTVVLEVGSWVVATAESLENLSFLVSRFLGITYICTLYVWTTPMADINLALRWYGLSYQAALVLTLAFRFIPFIADSFKMIQDSHALRTSIQVEGKHSRRQRIADAIPTVTAALVFALKSIPQVAMSLEHRGLGRANKRSHYRVLKAKGGLFTQLLLSVMIPTVFYLVFNTL
ncbi:energy-coupling factor transporter transmembrane component T family protein [Pleomorphochaeta sp. DL1XJH-081]|jgi:energy-coupling factor transport system permease protein|uniref:energy-coupling factor transporter transmembrane component T family protein n=1 Tax=Pleomorphochaeta sp. DL1XJH-081 TaxID=3409690 RepID=UPI003BB7EA50